MPASPTPQKEKKYLSHTESLFFKNSPMNKVNNPPPPSKSITIVFKTLPLYSS